MSEFKVGDRVTIHSKPDRDIPESFRGSEVTIIATYEDKVRVWDSHHGGEYYLYLYQIEGKNGIDDQTLQFWHLQLQFIQLPEQTLYSIWYGLDWAALYRKNKLSKKIYRILHEYEENYTMSEKERECLATHLALQLAGIDA